jgi:Rieske Fe-S protein
MEINRRRFVLLAAAGCAATCTAGCGAGGGGNTGDPADAPASLVPGLVDAGPLGDYAAEGLYSHCRDRGFFVVREKGRLFALSAVCTHRRCKLDARPDRSLLCKCHGSTFDPHGKVTRGPASRDLPELPTSVGAGERLLVRVPARA